MLRFRPKILKESIMREVIDLEKYKRDLQAAQAREGMSLNEISQASEAMNRIAVVALKNVNPGEKEEFVSAYQEIWENNIALKLSSLNLVEADLENTHLIKANLIDANLTRANLTGANMEWSNLKRANLIDANLTRANLTGANLQSANLLSANLQGANLKAADLTGANLTMADLTGANLTMADLTGTYLHKDSLKGAITIGSTGLTPEQKAKTISTTGELLATINSALEEKSENITEDIINRLPNLYQAAFSIGCQGYRDAATQTQIPADPDLIEAAEKLAERFPYLADPKGKENLIRESLSSGELNDEKKTNYLALTTLAQERTFSPELIIKIGSHLFGSKLSEENAYKLAAFTTSQRTPNPKEAAEATFASKEEKKILERLRF
jgi:uncharacterized protein YjbI with pentapeptide repeats